MQSMLTALLLCLVGITVAQRPVPCTAPPQWEASIFDSNQKEKFALEGRLTYDATYLRERLIDEVDEASGRDYFDTIALFDLKAEFIYNFKTRNCTRREIVREWRDFGIRANATSYGEAYIGSSAVPGANILLTIWGGNFTTSQNESIQYMSTWTYQGCVPVSRTTISQQSGVSQLSFYDVSVGIRDPNVFIPRRECLTSEEWDNRFTLFGTPAKKNV